MTRRKGGRRRGGRLLMEGIKNVEVVIDVLCWFSEALVGS